MYCIYILYYSVSLKNLFEGVIFIKVYEFTLNIATLRILTYSERHELAER